MIDVRMSYDVLLEHPWLYENGVIPSTLHQCFTYCKDGHVKGVFGDVKPFTEAKSYFADAKYFIQDAGTTKTNKSSNKYKQLVKSETGLPPSRADKGEQVLEDDGALKELTLHLTKIDDVRPSSQPSEGFTCPIRGARKKHREVL